MCKALLFFYNNMALVTLKPDSDMPEVLTLPPTNAAKCILPVQSHTKPLNSWRARDLPQCTSTRNKTKKSTILSSGAQARRAFTARCQSLPSTACDSHSLPACDLAGCPSNYPPSLGHRLKKHQQSKTPSFLHCSYHAHLKKKKKNSNHTRAKQCCKHPPWVDIQSTLWKAASTPLGWIFKARCEKLQAHPLGGYSKHAVKSCKHTPWVDIQSTLWKAASTPLGWIFKARCEKLQSLIQSHMRHEHNESAREWRIALYKSGE